MRVLLNSADTITDTARQILAKAKELSGVTEEFEFAPLEDDTIPPAGFPVLSLGSYKRRGQEAPVVTYSVPQLVTKADSLTRLSSAFKLLAGEVDLPEFKWELVSTTYELTLLSNRFAGHNVVVDIETRGQVDAQVPGWEHIISIAFYDGDSACVIPEDLIQNPDMEETICEILANSSIIAHNGKFDLKYLSDNNDGQTFYPEEDTMLMHYALFPAASSHGLKDLAAEYFGAEDWDSGNKVHLKGKTYTEFTKLEDGAYAYAMKYPANSGYERIPRSMLYEYNAYDVYWTWNLYVEFYRLLETDPDAQRVYEHLMNLSDLFQRIETPGNRYDVDYMTEFSKTLTLEGQQLEAELHELCGVPLNPRSPKQVKEYFEGQGYKLQSTDSDTMNELVERGSGVAKLILDIRKNTTINKTYIKGYLDKLIGDRGYQTYKLHAATTGRLGGGGPSMLTIPRDKRVKRMVLPDEGHVMVGADASQMELRILAMETNDPWLIAAFQPEAGDFFDLIMVQADPGIDPVHFKATDPQGYTDFRAKIKGTIYGKAFNRGDAAIATALGISLAEATKLSDAFIRPGSEFDAWRKDIERKAVRGLPIVNRFGRHFQSEIVTKRNRQQVVNSAMSFMSQSTGNDLLLSAALVVEPQLEQYKARFMGTIHDAIYASTPVENAEAVGELISREIIASGARVYGDAVSFVSDWNIGKNLSET